MSVPNSLPVKLSDVIAEFGGGASAPNNLGAYRAGAGYTPSGAKGGSAAIPVANAAIPSAFPLNLGAFPGSRKELTVTQYWPYKDYYHRNISYPSTNPPQTVARNKDLSDEPTSTNTGGYLSASQIEWQRKQFSNVNNASIPDSAQCTVVFMTQGTSASYANSMSGGTSLSVRAADPTGQSMHLTPIAYGKYNFVTRSSGGTTESSLVWASYNCSMKKITDIYTGLYPNGNNSCNDELLVLPGLKKVKEYAIAVNGSGADVKPSAPIAPDEVVFGLRYSTSGDSQIQFTNQTFANWLRSDNWWYNNIAFDIEANVGASAVALTTVVPQNNNPSNVWVVMNENTATVYAPGINPVWGSLTASGGSGSSIITLKRNGGITASINSVALDLPNYPTCPENWWIGNSLSSMPGDNYWVQLTAQSGYAAPVGPTGFVQLNADRSWSSPAGAGCVCNIHIADNAAGTNATYLGYVILSTATGGGGGGSCVEMSSFVFDGTRAKDAAVGKLLALADAQTLESSFGEVTYSKTKIQPGWCIETESGITLRCSESAPISTRENGYKTPAELMGEFVATRRDAPMGNQIQWERVARTYPVGDIAVQHITVGDRNFWAGQKPGEYILHHNLKDAGGD